MLSQEGYLLVLLLYLSRVVLPQQSVLLIQLLNLPILRSDQHLQLLRLLLVLRLRTPLLLVVPLQYDGC